MVDEDGYYSIVDRMKELIKYKVLIAYFTPFFLASTVFLFD